MTQHVSGEIQKVDDIIPIELVESLQKAAYNEVEQLWKDYQPTARLIEFCDLIQKESVYSRILSFRFATSHRINELLRYVTKGVEQTGLQGPFVFAPLLYLRFCYPKIFISEKHEKALLYTEPHYDNCYGFDGL